MYKRFNAGDDAQYRQVEFTGNILVIAEPRIRSVGDDYGYTGDEAEFAVQNCGADWNESALSAARSYMRMGYSADEIAAILADDGYTSENILYALDNIE